jgi:prepilin-type N-terminal cleavage/methylation domain-containing protein
MKTSPQTKRSNHGKADAFTLIEMIGVLAVIAILAALLVPKVFSAISDARVNSTCINIDTVKTATADHYGKYGKLNSFMGLTPDIPTNILSFDRSILLPEGLIDKVFSSKLAGGDPTTNATIQLLQTPTPAIGNGGNGYKLDGQNTVSNATFMIEAVLYGVSAQDAFDLHNRIDGQALSNPPLTVGVPCGVGRVEYANTAPYTVYVYITSR